MKEPKTTKELRREVYEHAKADAAADPADVGPAFVRDVLDDLEAAEAEVRAWRAGNPSDDLWRVRMEQAERERDAALAKLTDPAQPLPSNLAGYLAVRDAICAVLGIEPTWSWKVVEAVAELKATE